MISQAVGPLKDPSVGPAVPPQQQQLRPGMARPPGPQGQRMGAPTMGGPRMGGPRMSGPRMSGPRMAGPRQAGPQRPPEPAQFSGFMSMFSTPNAPSETTKSDDSHQSGTESGQGDTCATVTVSESIEATNTEKASSSGDGCVKSPEDVEVNEKGLEEKEEQTDITEAQGSSLTESIMQSASLEKESGDEGHAEHLEAPDSALSDKAVPPPAPETKGDEKPSAKEEPSSASSVFGMKLGSMFGNSDPPQPESTPPVVTVQPQSQSPKPMDEICELDPEKLSQCSGETESADSSDTEGPTENSNTGSCDTFAESPQSGLPSLSISLEEGLDKPQLKITPCEVDKNDVDTPDTMHADLGTEQPKDLPPDCSRFDSSGNLSPASSQLSSEPEERRDPENPPRTLRPPHESQKSSWNEEENEEEFEKELHPLPEPDGPPPCSPSKVRWLKAYNKVRVQLLESRMEDNPLL
ncbi:hypothetical protein NQZ68_028272 [Dissostichus eleginoides]|nr:hypothetical protein NQZ68_028272 [Dissostichus eleginoides]